MPAGNHYPAYSGNYVHVQRAYGPISRCGRQAWLKMHYLWCLWPVQSNSKYTEASFSLISMHSFTLQVAQGLERPNWWYSCGQRQRQRQQQTIALPLAHAHGVTTFLPLVCHILWLDYLQMCCIALPLLFLILSNKSRWQSLWSYHFSPRVSYKVQESILQNWWILHNNIIIIIFMPGKESWCVHTKENAWLLLSSAVSTLLWWQDPVVVAGQFQDIQWWDRLIDC